LVLGSLPFSIKKIVNYDIVNLKATLYFAFLFMGIQSLIYSVVLEFIGSRMTAKGNFTAMRFVVSSVLLGALASASLCIYCDLTMWFIMITDGVLTGLACGYVLAILHRKSNQAL